MKHLVTYKIINTTILYNIGLSELYSYRKQLSVSQVDAANVLGVSVRTYQRYEKSTKLNGNKLESIKAALNAKFGITEEKGILSISRIHSSVTPVLEKHGIEMCILFGSYAKGKATDKSDVDLLIKTDIKGLKFISLVDELHNALNKKVDLITIEQLTTSQELLEEILKDGVKLI